MRDVGAEEQATTLADRAAASAALTPGRRHPLLGALREAGAQIHGEALAARAAAHRGLDNPDAVARLLEAMQGMALKNKLLHWSPAPLRPTWPSMTRTLSPDCWRPAEGGR